MYCNYLKKKKTSCRHIAFLCFKAKQAFCCRMSQKRVYTYIYIHTKAFILKQSSFKHFEKLTTALGYCKDPI